MEKPFSFSSTAKAKDREQGRAATSKPFGQQNFKFHQNVNRVMSSTAGAELLQPSGNTASRTAGAETKTNVSQTAPIGSPDGLGERERKPIHRNRIEMCVIYRLDCLLARSEKLMADLMNRYLGGKADTLARKSCQSGRVSE